VAQGVKRDYATDRIVVHWDSDRCMHSENCVRGLPVVFEPWIAVDAAPADEVAAAVDRCPSGALTYTRLDGAEPGPAGYRPPTDDDVVATVTVRANGPYVVDGPVRIQASDGTLISIERRAFLCRCGRSSAKPFCDGTHKAHRGLDER
jgi:uncharacterized Fe-S cluster protein YjdI